jgi:K+-transporting ATPase KdpF subunit
LWWQSRIQPVATTCDEELTMNAENALILIISVLLMVYLVYALLRPEKF